MKFLFGQITRLSLKFRILTLLATFVLMTLGAISWTQLNQELLPPIDIPQTIILTQTSGLSGEQILALVTKPLEDNLIDIEDVINLQSETQSSFGSFITVFNDFGIDQESLRERIREAVDATTLPLRRLIVSNPAALLAELDGETLIFLAEEDPNFLFQLSPTTWASFSDDTLRTVLAYMAQTEEQTQGAANALQQLVDKEVVPQINSLSGVVRIDVAGGQELPESATNVQTTQQIVTETQPLIARLSPDVWAQVQGRLGISAVTPLDAVDAFADESFTVPTTSPQLPESWQAVNGTATHFNDATDLLEVPALTTTMADVFNDFLDRGEIVAALGQTDDLTVATVENVLMLDPAMASYFEAEQILALPDDVFAYLLGQASFIENLDAFTRDAVAARTMATTLSDNGAESVARVPVDLPDEWQISPPQLITFSFSDIPLASFSVFVTGEIESELQTDVPAPEAVTETERNGAESSATEARTEPEAPTIVDAPLPAFFAMAGQGFGIALDNTSDLLAIELPEDMQAFFGAEAINAAQFLNVLAVPPTFEEGEAPEGFDPAMMSQASLLVGQLTADNIAYLVANEPDFAANLLPETVALLSESAVAVLGLETTVAQGEADGEIPALNPEWAALSGLIESFMGTSVELDTADDLLNPALPLNVFLPQMLSTPNIGDLLSGMFGNFPVDAALYVVDQSPTYFDSFPPEILAFFNPAVVAVLPENVQAAYPGPVLPEAWTTLMTQTGAEVKTIYTVADLLALSTDGLASDVLNQIDSSPVDPALNSYTVRLMDSITPAMFAVFEKVEPDFFANLSADVVLKFSSAALNTLLVDEIEALPNLSAEQITQVLNIRENPDQSAFAQLASQYASNVPAGDPLAPELNPGWQNLGNFYSIELDSADDFFRFPEGFPFETGAQFMDSLFGSAQGEQFAPVWFGELPIPAMEYMLNRDPAFFDTLSSRGLSLLPPEGLALLSPALQERAAESASTFKPDAQVTRTDGNDSLFIVVYKDADANTVTTYYEVWDKLKGIDEQNDNIEIGVAFEQSSFVEDSIEGVAREGSLGAVFAIIIILIFLSGGVWKRNARNVVGMVMLVVFAGGMILLVASNLSAAGNDWGQAFAQSDVVIRVLLIVGMIAGLFTLVWPGHVLYPAWRATLVIAVSIPLSIMTALVGMSYISPAMNELLAPLASNGGFFEFIGRLFPDKLTLNIMTLSGLTVAIGRVVDDSIVVLENIFRYLQASENPTKEEKQKIIIQGVRDVAAAIFTATLISMVVFLPLGLTGGLIGAFFLPFGLAVTYALVGSFIVAITVVPVLAYYFTDVKDMPEDSDIFVADSYLPILKWTLRNSWTKATVIVLALASVGVAAYLFSQRPFAFLPSFGEPQVTVSVNLPGGTSIVTTNELVAEMEAWITANIDAEKVITIQTIVGGGGANFDSLLSGNTVSENSASLTLGLDASQADFDAITKQVEREAKFIFNTCPTSDAVPNTPEQRALMTVEEIDGVEEVVCADGSSIESHVTVAGASVSDGGFGGFALVVSGPITEEVNRSIKDAINGIDGLSRADSNFVDGADTGSATIIRVNLETAYSYTAEVNTENTIGVTQQAIVAIQDVPAIAENLCTNGDTLNCFAVSQGFESEIQTEGFTSLGFAMVIAIGIVVVILGVTMQSFVYWLAIIFSIIVTPIGAAIALTSADRTLGISAMIGLLMLIGLVIANGVVLIDRVRSNRRERGMPLKEALVEAGGRRLRPILMTSLATIIALVPLAIGLSQGAIIASELGTVVIGGSISSTILTLIVVPVVFSVLSPLHRVLSFRKDAETRTSDAGNQPE